jgi:hypothetical protein
MVFIAKHFYTIVYELDNRYSLFNKKKSLKITFT